MKEEKLNKRAREEPPYIRYFKEGYENLPDVLPGNRIRYGDFVFMPEHSAHIFIRQYGEDFFLDCVAKLDGWIGQNAPAEGERISEAFAKQLRNGWNGQYTLRAWVIRSIKSQEKSRSWDDKRR